MELYLPYSIGIMVNQCHSEISLCKTNISSISTPNKDSVISLISYNMPTKIGLEVSTLKPSGSLLEDHMQEPCLRGLDRNILI